VLILLPPSEGKAAPRRRGRPADLAALGLPELTATRAAVRASLAAVSASPDALSVLGVGESLRPDVEQNTRLDSTPATGALEVYTGVLYDALGWPTLSTGARRRASRALRVQSALWGPVGPADRIAPYRLSMGTVLPGLGPLAAVWRPVLAGPMAELVGDRVLVDCRSAPYAAAWSPRGEAARRRVVVRVWTEVDGRRSVVSHLAKQTRGLVARELLEHPDRLRSVDDVARAVAIHHHCTLVDLGAGGFALDVVR
jgi:cytoplasmic iron level regulating protein YaaA (DUF328/UPF0246 family)